MDQTLWPMGKHLSRPVHSEPLSGNPFICLRGAQPSASVTRYTSVSMCLTVSAESPRTRARSIRQRRKSSPGPLRITYRRVVTRVQASAPTTYS
ncbi:hypothetical protein CRUP_005805 [Coryphaenoides rupestris]|nr:hypothetical protein CRUP_005805 [Coryphaenoides rupestris]